MQQKSITKQRSDHTVQERTLQAILPECTSRRGMTLAIGYFCEDFNDILEQLYLNRWNLYLENEWFSAAP